MLSLHIEEWARLIEFQIRVGDDCEFRAGDRPTGGNFSSVEELITDG
jgi:hypothetical protein